MIYNSILGTHCEIALRWMPKHLSNERSTLVQVMAWCHQAPTGVIYLHSWKYSLFERQLDSQNDNGINDHNDTENCCAGSPVIRHCLMDLHCLRSCSLMVSLWLRVISCLSQVKSSQRFLLQQNRYHTYSNSRDWNPFGFICLVKYITIVTEHDLILVTTRLVQVQALKQNGHRKGRDGHPKLH